MLRSPAWIVLIFATAALAQSPGERMAAGYFGKQTAKLAERALGDIRSLEEWRVRRDVYRQQLLEMLGLTPLPQKSDLQATIVGKIEAEKFSVEKIYFQSVPGLYVTANLYIPKDLEGRAPTILYLCGHARVLQDGTSYGNKASYQHHPTWFAEHGYVAMIIDTLDLGEIEGEHHGTSRRGWWWWPTRGYTPAGVETWNAIRALDYLSTRAEVDMQRIGVTGRSGGGAYTWFVAGVDDRPSVLVPVAGITDMTNHVVDGAIEGHCDCMYHLNSYAWDFSILAALSAPRPLLLANSDKDKIFPLDGVLRIHNQVKKIYQLYSAEEKLGLLITEGPHRDTQDLQLPAFRWMNRWLKKDDSPIDLSPTTKFSPQQLKVLRTAPPDQINTRIHESFVPGVKSFSMPSTRHDWEMLTAHWTGLLRNQVFRNWPEPSSPRSHTKIINQEPWNGARVRMVEFSPDDAYRLPTILLSDPNKKTKALTVRVLDRIEWSRWAPVVQKSLPGATSQGRDKMRASSAEDEILSVVRAGTAMALALPRGVGPTAWPSEKDTQIRRRFLLLGQSLESLQVWDTRAALAALRTIPELVNIPVSLQGSAEMSIVALFAAIFEPAVGRLELESPPVTLSSGPSFPNLLRYLDLPQAVALALPRTITIRGSSPAAWEWSVKVANLTGGTINFR